MCISYIIHRQYYIFICFLGTRKQNSEQQGSQICQLLVAKRFRQRLFVLAQLLQTLPSVVRIGIESSSEFMIG